MTYKDDCGQLALDNNWTLTRKNACHIGVINSEMGQMRDDINIIRIYQGINLAIWGAIGLIILGLVIKKMWGNNKIA